MFSVKFMQCQVPALHEVGILDGGLDVDSAGLQLREALKEAKSILGTRECFMSGFVE